MEDISRINRILKREASIYRLPVIELIEAQTKDPEKILIATILSARTKDQTTKEASKRLFEKVSRISDLKNFKKKEIEKIIFPVGFYKNKARMLKKLPETLEKKFSGKLPENVEELCELPGVGRKTANLVVAVGFHKPAICVDTHVHRITNRIGYVNTRTPVETEFALRKKLPKKYWKTFNTYLVAFGQHLCHPVSPECSICPIKDYCKRIGVKKSR